MFPFQAPPIRDKEEIENILGTSRQQELSRDVNVLWVWGVDKIHDVGLHEYGWTMDRFVNTLLPLVPGVTASQTMWFPTQEQWNTADLVVFFLQSKEAWGEKHFEQIDAFQGRGGGLIFLHLGLLQGDGSELAKRIGLAYGLQNAPNGTTRWGALPTPVHLAPGAGQHPIMAGFPEAFHLVDELYWNLTGDTDDITTLITSPAGPEGPRETPPVPEDLDGKAWPVAWTKETETYRSFGSVVGHNYFTFNDPYFRIVLLRAMAWTMGEPFDPFRPLVDIHMER